jgi:hypothetical protein
MKLGRQGKRNSGSAYATAPRRMSRSLPFSSEIAGSRAARWPANAARPRKMGWFRPRCRWAAARIRTATGVKGPDLGRERIADQRTPWVGLLLWAIACAGLLVSLLTQHDELRRDPQVAGNETIRVQHPDARRPLVLTGQAAQLGLPPAELPLPH